ncbi:MAG: hypothetical protein ACYDDU_11165 [Dermatophilaceae bacterium]
MAWPTTVRTSGRWLLQRAAISMTCSWSRARATGAVDALFDGLRTIARERGWSKIRSITADDNHRARSKYDQVAERTSWVIYDKPVSPCGS